MVYKKIGNKIPSLSSLLLAGVMLVPGGCECDKETNLNPGGPDGGRQPIINNTEDKGGIQVAEPPKNIDVDLLQSGRKIREALMTLLGLDYLGKGKLLVLSQEDLALDNMMPMARTLIDSFVGSSSDCYPNRLVEVLRPLSNINDKEVQYSRALADALNIFPTYIAKFREIAKEMWARLNTGGGFDALQAVKKDSFDPLHEEFDPTNAKFKLFNGYIIPNVLLPGLLTGPQLVRFFTDTGKDGKPKTTANKNGKAYGVPSILGKECELFILNKIATMACQDATEPSSVHLGKRGCGIPGLSVQDSSAPMPQIAKIPNGYLTSTFDRDILNEFCKNTQKTIDDVILSKVPQLSASPSVIYSGKTDQRVVAKQGDPKLSIGTLLFTLFKGTTEFDFLHVVPSKNKSKAGVLLQGNNANFQKWLKQDPKEFANRLYNHIKGNRELEGLFLIPNLKDLFNFILPSTELDKIDDTAFANVGGSIDNDGITDIKESSALGIICKNILNKLKVYPENDGDILMFIKRLNDLYKDPKLSKADVTFEEMMCMGVISEIMSQHAKFSPTDKKALSKLNLVRNIKDYVTRESRKSIVMIGEDGECQPASGSSALRDALDGISRALANKYDNACYTYEGISKIKGHDNKENGFAVDSAAIIYEEELEKIGQVLMIDTDALLIKQADITKQDFSNIEDTGIGIGSAFIAEVNSIKKEYQVKKNKQLVDITPQK